MALLTCENVALGYDNRAVVSNLNFSINSGDYLIILGENGSGKTTLMKSILGLIKPIGGRITTGDGLTANQIGYLPQQNDIQKDFPAAVREIVLSGCLNQMGWRPFYNKHDKALAQRNMARLGIDHLANRSYAELSGGQQQRVLLARALCAMKKMLVLDEPVAGLDPKASEDMYNLIHELNQQGVTIAMISHDLLSIDYSSHILSIGKAVFYGTTDQYRQLIDKKLHCEAGVPC